jgi:membrane fusion protein (multidrug efflux system)
MCFSATRRFGFIHKSGPGLGGNVIRDKRMRVGLILCLLAIAALVSGCGQDQATAEPSETPRVAQPAPSPRIEPPSALLTEQSDDAVIASGPLVVEHQLDLVAQREGIVVKLLADTGMRLEAGDLLVQLDDRQNHSELEATRAKTRSIEAELKSREAGQKVLQADYERAKKMWEADLLPREQFEHAKLKMESGQWEIRRATELLANSKQTERGLELELEKMQIQAPFQGIVARRYVREGQSVVKGDRLFWFTADEPLRLRFTVPEKYANRLQIGRRFALTSPNFPEEPHTARVIEISPVVDPASGTIEAMVELVGAPRSLRTGMAVNLRIEKMK